MTGMVIDSTFLLFVVAGMLFIAYRVAPEARDSFYDAKGVAGVKLSATVGLSAAVAIAGIVLIVAPSFARAEVSWAMFVVFIVVMCLGAIPILWLWAHIERVIDEDREAELDAEYEQGLAEQPGPHD